MSPLRIVCGFTALGCLMLVGCAPPPTVGGKVTGLDGGVVVLGMGDQTLSVEKNGDYTFPQELEPDASYHVLVKTQPANQHCGVSNGQGTVHGLPITNADVSCSGRQGSAGGGGDNPDGGPGGNGGNPGVNSYAIMVTVSGLHGVLWLDNSGADVVHASADGPVRFADLLQSGEPYNVTVSQQPEHQTCTVQNGTGTVASADITNITVTCANNPTYAVQAQVSGLTATLVLNDGTDALNVTSNGTATFPTRLYAGQSYNVTVTTQPPGQICTVGSGGGQVAAGDVTGVTVSCVALPPSTYLVQATVSGLSGGTLTLHDNGDDELNVTANGTVTFGTHLQSGQAYNVTIAGQPAGQTCTVTNGSGVVAGANVSNIGVACQATPPSTYAITAQVSGLVGGLLLNNNSANPLPVTANGPNTFSLRLTSGQAYNVTVAMQPSGQTCTVTNGSGVVATADVSNVLVTCVTPSYHTITVTIHNLSGNVGLSDGHDTATVSSAGTSTVYTFSTQLLTGTSYNVVVVTSPPSQICNVFGGSGVVGGVDINNISINCIIDI